MEDKEIRLWFSDVWLSVSFYIYSCKIIISYGLLLTKKRLLFLLLPICTGLDMSAVVTLPVIGAIPSPTPLVPRAIHLYYTMQVKWFLILFNALSIDITLTHYETSALSDVLLITVSFDSLLGKYRWDFFENLLCSRNASTSCLDCPFNCSTPALSNAEKISSRWKARHTFKLVLVC